MTLGLPDCIRACLFDLDGVLTKTAKIHAAAWKEMFDAYLAQRAERLGEPFQPFDIHDDYDAYVDGKPRPDGVRDFLASRGIHLPEGGADDRPGSETVSGLGLWKNDIVQRRIHRDGVEVYSGSVAFVRAAKDAGLRRAVVSSSKNCREVLQAAGILDLFEERVDGDIAEREHLAGKPAPDTFLAAARLLGVTAAEAAVFEDALAGVAAGRAGRFGYVIGVDRVGQAEALAAHGADRVVQDLAELLEDRGSR
jgi:beta-phosphoglucomutase family hydrolase